MPQPFRIGVSSGFKTAAPGTIEPVLARLIDPLPHVEWDLFDAGSGEPVAAAAIADFEGVIAMGSPYDASTVAGSERLACVARWGVGYDLVDTEALTANDVLLAIAVDAVRKPVAEAILTLILALAKKLAAKDRLVRTGRWDLKAQTSGLGLRRKDGRLCRHGQHRRRNVPSFRPVRPGAAPYPRPVSGSAASAGAKRRTGEPGDNLPRIGLCRDQLPVDRRDAWLHQCPPFLADEAERIFHQHGAGSDRQPGGSCRGAASRGHSRRRSGCGRAGAAATRIIR